MGRKSNEALGTVTREFSALEFMWITVTWSLMQNEDATVGQIMTAKMSFRNVREAAWSLTLHRFEDAPEEIEIMRIAKGSAEKAEEERNLIVHSAWFHSGEMGEGRMKITTGKTGLQFRHEPFTLTDINNVLMVVETARQDLLHFIIRNLTALDNENDVEDQLPE